MSGRVESGSKAFARMQQGTGGSCSIIRYLSFYIICRWSCFQSYAERCQHRKQQSQVAFAASTGVNMKAIAEQLKAATSALLDFTTQQHNKPLYAAKGFTLNK